MKESDLKVESIFPKGKGGQHVGEYYNSIRVTHIPTGMIAECGYERSQYKNRKIVMEMMEYGLLTLGWNNE